MEENKIKEAAEKYMKSDELRYFQDPCDFKDFSPRKGFKCSYYLK